MIGPQGVSQQSTSLISHPTACQEAHITNPLRARGRPDPGTRHIPVNPGLASWTSVDSFTCSGGLEETDVDLTDGFPHQPSQSVAQVQ